MKVLTLFYVIFCDFSLIPNVFIINYEYVYIVSMHCVIVVLPGHTHLPSKHQVKVLCHSINLVQGLYFRMIADETSVFF